MSMDRDRMEIALAFSRECCGWTNAQGFWNCPLVFEKVSHPSDASPLLPYLRYFHYTRIEQVMAAVWEWLLSLDARTADDIFGNDLQVILADGFLATDRADLGHRLLAACVRANRRRQGIQRHG